MARTRPRIRWLPLLVGAVVILCAVAVLTALLLPTPTPEATPPVALPAPVAAPRAAPSPLPPPPPPPAPPLPVAPPRAESSSFDWRSLPVVARNRRRPAGALLRATLPRLQACMAGWKRQPGAPRPAVDVTLGLLSTVAGLEVEHVDITGGTVRDAATEACIVGVLVGNRIPGVPPPVGTRTRVADRLFLPLPPPPQEAPSAVH